MEADSHAPGIQVTTRLKRTLLWMLVASLALAATMGILAFLGGDQLGLDDWRLHLTNLAFAFASLTALGCALCLEKGRARHVCVFGLFASACAFVLFELLIWSPAWLESIGEGYFARAAGIATIWAICCPHFAILSFARPGAGLAWVIPTTRVVTVLLALLLTVIVLSDGGDNELVFRAVGVLGTLTLLGTITLPVLHWIAVMRGRDGVVTTSLPVTLTCPRCGQTETRTAGRSACSTCGLRIRLEIEEERCPGCGYALYQLTSDRCPECGATISTLMRSGSSQKTA